MSYLPIASLLKSKPKFKSVYDDSQSLEYFLNNHLEQNILRKELPALTEAIMAKNYFCCSTDNDVNVSGTAMGT